VFDVAHLYSGVYRAQVCSLVVHSRSVRLSQDGRWNHGNTDFEFTTLNVRGLKLQLMEIEEAVIIGLLAVGMSLLAVLTIMIFW